MPVVNPNSSVIAKAKAKYGRRLRQKDYKSLVKCQNVGDIVRYLKTYTSYSAFLSKISSDIHRGNLENILREELFKNYLSLCRYNRADSPVTGYIFRKTEIDELIKYLTLLSISRPVDYIFSLPLYLDEHTEIPLNRLSSAHSYSEMLDLLPNCGYKDVLTRFIPGSDEEIDIAAIDDALRICSLEELYSDISKIKNKGEKERLTSMFNILVDYNNYSRIIRLKKYYKLNEKAGKKNSFPLTKQSMTLFHLYECKMQIIRLWHTD